MKDYWLALSLGARSYEDAKNNSVIINPARTSTQLQHKHRTPRERYVGNVWCLRVNTGAFVVRRNGRPFITGNSGFPKSHDVSKGIDKASGAKRKIIGSKLGFPGYSSKPNDTTDHNRTIYGSYTDAAGECAITIPATPEAAQWEGWGTALKPAWEPIIVARKPLDGTVAENVLKYGTGAMNIDACRVHAPDAQGGEYTIKRLKPGATLNQTGGNWRPEDGPEYHGEMKPGRWPANVIHDGSDEILNAFPNAPGQLAKAKTDKSPQNNKIYGPMMHNTIFPEPRNDSGSAARFFYCAKANKKDRAGSKHPTVKPLSLMRYLVRLVTPPGGVVLDPFAGSGATLQAAHEEGFNAIGIEMMDEYVNDILCRVGLREREEISTAEDANVKEVDAEEIETEKANAA